MANANWMLYGATGFTGELIVEEAVRRGHKPVLAGRSAAKLEPVAARYGLPFVAVDLQDSAKLSSEVAKVGAVVHAAGPFIHTAEPMRQACLAARAHYLDITGEIAVFQGSFALDARARERKVAILSGVGFDVVPTDCLAAYVAAKLPNATSLELAFAATGGASAGTTKSALEHANRGNLARRNGVLVRVPFGRGAKRVHFPSRPAWVMPIPWGDVETAFHTTGIPNITTYLAVPSRIGKQAHWAWPLMNGAFWLGAQALKLRPLKQRVQRLVEQRVKGPDERTRQTGRSYVWARAEAPDGRSVEAWLDTAEGYTLTAFTAVSSVERALKGGVVGATTPASAFGADFVLEVPGTKRLDALLP